MGELTQIKELNFKIRSIQYFVCTIMNQSAYYISDVNIDFNSNILFSQCRIPNKFQIFRLFIMNVNTVL